MSLRTRQGLSVAALCVVSQGFAGDAVASELPRMNSQDPGTLRDAAENLIHHPYPGVDTQFVENMLPSIVLILKETGLDCDATECRLRTRTLEEYARSGNGSTKPVCDDSKEMMARQTVNSHDGERTVSACTGFVVQRGAIATAWHCATIADPEHLRFVFNYSAEGPIPIAQVCYGTGAQRKPVKDPRPAADWALMSFSQEDCPAAWSATKLPTVASKTDADPGAFILGHGLGLPTMLAFNGSAQVLGAEGDYLAVSLDSNSGYSGSPIFVRPKGTTDWAVIGLLYRGMEVPRLSDFDNSTCCLGLSVASERDRPAAIIQRIDPVLTCLASRSAC